MSKAFPRLGIAIKKSFMAAIHKIQNGIRLAFPVSFKIKQLDLNIFQLTVILVYALAKNYNKLLSSYLWL